jgi:hypothetical protein
LRGYVATFEHDAVLYCRTGAWLRSWRVDEFEYMISTCAPMHDFLVVRLVPNGIGYGA